MNDELITLVKDGGKIRVHPLSVPNHLELGWVKLEVVEPAPVPVAEPVSEPALVPEPIEPAADERKPRRRVKS